MRGSFSPKFLCFCAALLLAAALSIAVIQVTSAANGSVTYTYDPLGRVSTVNYDTGVCIAYAYDANGNRTSQRIVVSGSGATGIWGCFNWNQANWGS